jgi:hypothetical protein
MIVHCPRSLGAAAPLLAAELQYCDGLLTTWAQKRSHAVDQFDGVISHSFKSSPLSRHDSEPKFLRLESASTSVPAEAVDPGQSSFCAGRVTAIARDLCLLRACIFAELGTIFFACRWNADTRQVGTF